MDATLQVYDGFYEDVDSVREYALSCEYRRPDTGTWPGYHSVQRHPDSKDAFFKLARLISPTARANWEELEVSRQFWGRPSAGLFALLLHSQADTVHFHRHRGAWAAACYLSLGDHWGRRDAVRLFRHKRTGLESCAGADPQVMEELRRDAPDKSKWELTHRVPMKFNRAVLFDATLFHAASEGFGGGPDDGRLAQVFNLDIVSA